MSAPRLTFLYPFLFAPAKPVTVRSASRTARRALTTSGRRRQPAAHQRYGAANEPPPHLGSAKNVKEQRFTPPKDAKDSLQPKSEFQKERDLETASEEALRTDTAENSNNKKKKKKKAVKPHATEDAPAIEVLPPTTNLPPSPIMDASESMPISGPSPQPRIHAKPLETVLNMPSSDITGTPTSPVYQSDTLSTFHPPSPDTEPQGETFIQEERPQPLEQQKPPHISTPPYVHHFDTYGLVRRLEEGGWTQEQAITLMKAVRLILNENMDLARHGLVSKSNVENETYLFSAACSELKTEIQTKRNKEGERSRTERTQLQHEVDILGQRMTQESATMKDELKGMFDDRKMFVRNDQRDMERKVSDAAKRPFVLSKRSWSNIRPSTDTRTQLPHHRLPELRLTLRCRRRALAHHQARNLRPRNLCRYDPGLTQIRLECCSMAGR